jgi:hypothetical protein
MPHNLDRVRLSLSFLAATYTLAAQTPPVSFDKEVRPVLERSCSGCHLGQQQMAGFSLSTRETAVRGGSHGAAIVPGNAAGSALYQRLSGKLQPSMPVGGKLTDAEIATIGRWINEGAKWEGAATIGTTATAATPASRKITDADRKWWAFVKPVRRQPPAATDARWNRSPIDQFIHAKLRERELTPAGRAPKQALIRRLALDLTGLPPTPTEVDAFVKDDAPDAYVRLVNRVLDSPRYGERWGRHWLDVARYADSGGYEQDFTYPNAWRYRDYVIKAFNQDKPYDRFIREQIAGDELDDADAEALTGTGFHRVGSTVGFREKDNPQYRYIYLDDMIGTTTRAFLGMTVSCARCHDHKFDPISQVDYYRLMAVFNPYINYDHPLAPPSDIAAYEAKRASIQAELDPLLESIRALEAPYRKQAFEQKLATFPKDIQDAVHTPEAQRTEGQKLLATQVLSIRPNNHRALMTPADRASADKLQAQVRDLQKQMPKPLPVAMGVRDGDYRLAPMGPGDDEAPGKAGSGKQGDDRNDTYVPVAGKPYKPPKSYFLEAGDYLSPKAEMEPGFLEIVGDLGIPKEIVPKDGRITTGRRRALAEWIANPENPLTARVMVNRIWQHHFGKGLVLTSSNFGRLGRRPTHPELLDWLATEFMQNGWSMKHIHRLILLSETYQQDSRYDSAKSLEADPDNQYLWHYPQRRLEGEAIRDSILAVSGKLNLEAGGPSYFPPVPERVRKSVAKGIWMVNEEGPAVWRRGVYSYFKRGMKYPMFEVFDQPDPNLTCESRSNSTVPTQALTMLNNDFIIQQSRYFAERVLQQAGPGNEPRIRAAYRLALSREPSSRELQANAGFLDRQREAHRAKASPETEALADLCDVLLNLNEFLYIN